MKITKKLHQWNALDKALAQIDASGKLGYAIVKNRSKISKALREIREKAKPSPEFEALQTLRREVGSKAETEEEFVTAKKALDEQHAETIANHEKRQEEVREMGRTQDATIDLHLVSETDVETAMEKGQVTSSTMFPIWEIVDEKTPEEGESR